MANGVTALGGGWSDVPKGDSAGDYAENALALLLQQGGAMDGETIISALKDLGYTSRGPAYYNSGPYYALGDPHNYAALSADRSAWDLIHSGSPPWSETPGGRLPLPPGPPTPPAPLPPVPDLKPILLDMAAACDTLAADFRKLSAVLP